MPPQPVPRQKDRVLVLRRNPIEFDHFFVDGANSEELPKFVKQQKLSVKEFKDFTLYYSRKVLGIEDCQRQAVMLSEISDQLKNGSRIVQVNQLSQESQSTIRGMFQATQGDDLMHSVALNDNLQLNAGLESTVQIHCGPTSASYTLYSNPRWDDRKALLNTIPSDERIKKDSAMAKEYSEMQKRPAATPFLSFLFSSTTDSVQRLDYLAEVQSFLKSECVAAKQTFDAASKKVMASVSADFAKRYDKLAKIDRNPTFADLDSEDQSDVRSMFRQSHQSGQMDSNSFLDNARTDSVRTDFALTMYYPADPTGAHVITIHVGCPIKP